MRHAHNEIRGTLFAIALRLFSLAGLAESAARAPADRRVRALGFIYRGEEAALGLLADELPDHGDADIAEPTPECASGACPDRIINPSRPHTAQEVDGDACSFNDYENVAEYPPRRNESLPSLLAGGALSAWLLPDKTIDDALQLAARLRMMAWIVANLALLAATDDAGAPLAAGRTVRGGTDFVATGKAGNSFALTPPYADTS